MRTRMFLAFFLLLTMAKGPYAQGYGDPNAISIPSANNKFFVSGTSYQVNLHTGSAMPSVSLYELGSRGLKIPVSLSYMNSRGVKVQDVSNFVGLGWSLGGSGNISREVRGLPDEETNGYIGTNQFGKTINTAGESGVTTDILNKVGTGQYDGEPDYFNVSTPFFNFQFVFDENGNPVFPDSSGYKITHNLYNNSDPTNTSFTVTDDQGNQYFFGSTSASREKMTTTLSSNSKTFTSTWYLDKIVTYNSADQINFNYTTGGDYTVTHYSVTSTTLTSSGSCSVSNAPITNNINQGMTYNAPKYLSSITSSLGEVDFNYLFDRRDFTNAARLLSMQVFPIDPSTSAKGSLIKTFQFNYGYFGDPSTDSNQLRLRLDSIQETGNPRFTPSQQLTVKTFSYNTTSNLPPRNSVEFDYWGYYNTNTSGTTIVPAANKAPDATRVSANILTGIYDIIGESTQFQYEPNTYYANGQNTVAAGVRINQVSRSDGLGANIFTQYIYNDESGNSTGQVYNTSYTNFTKNVNTLIVGGGSFCGVTGVNTTSECIYNSYDLNGDFVGYSQVKTLYQNGGYELDSYTNFNDFPDFFNYKTSNNSAYGFSGGRQLSAATSLAYKRGLLLDKVIFKANGDTISKAHNIYVALGLLATRSVAVKASGYTYVLGSSVTAWLYGTYHSNTENYVLSQTTETTFDQSNQGLTAQNTVNYSYAADKRLVQATNVTDSKGNTRSSATYRTGDNGIPSLTPGEQSAISLMQQANRTNVSIHKVENHNGSISTFHSSYKTSSYANKTFLASSSTFFDNSTLARTMQYVYDEANSLQVSSNQFGGKNSCTLYGYNHSFPVATISGSDYATVSGLITQSVLDNPADDQTLRTELDKIRNGLAGTKALVNTYTYAPLMGITSQTDADGRTTFYEYDGLNRLYLVRDKDNKILKRYCYNYYGQQGNCPVPVYTPPPATVYAQISYASYDYSNGYIYADVVVSFYSDQACTLPVSVNNLTVNLLGTVSCDNNCENGTNQLGGLAVSGTSYTIFKGAALTYPSSWTDQSGDHPCNCSINYSLDTGTGYIPVN